MHEQVCVSELEAIERRSTTSRLRLYISLSVNAIHEYVLTYALSIIITRPSVGNKKLHAGTKSFPYLFQPS
jgi:hypothetical protein